MIQLLRVANLKMRIDRTRTLIRRPVNEQRNSRLDQGAGAHRAWLDRRIDRRASQPVITDFGGRHPDRDHLGMGGRIAISARSIAGDGDDFALPNDASAHRHLASRLSLARRAQGFAHPALVGLDLRGGTLRQHFVQTAKLQL